MSLIDDINTTY